MLDALGMTGGEMFAFRCTHGSNLDLADDVWDPAGNHLSLDRDIYPNYDLILCISTFSATAPLTAKCKEFGFRGATLHGLNEVILNSGLAVDYHEVSADAERMRLALTKADSVEIDFALEDGRVLTAWLGLDGQEAQKSHGLCIGRTPDIANLPAGEVYFVPRDARGQFPMKYEDGTLGVLDVEDRCIFRSTLIEGNQATIDAHNQRLARRSDDRHARRTGIRHPGAAGFRRRHPGREGARHLPPRHRPRRPSRRRHPAHRCSKSTRTRPTTTSLFAPHKTPNFNIRQVRMKRGAQEEILIENFRPARYLMDALAAGR